MEFAYIERNSCNVWLGSPSEIAAAIYQTGKMRFDVKRNHSNATDLDLPIIDRLATSSSPEEFCTTACSLGLPMSSRTARRILNGQVVPSKAFSPEDFNPTFYDAKIPTHGAPEQKDALESILSSTDDRGLKIEDSDLRVLRESISESFKEIASKYYLNDSVLPEVLVSKGKIRISIPVIKQ